MASELEQLVKDIHKGRQLQRIADNLDPIHKQKVEAKLLKKQTKIEAKVEAKLLKKQTKIEAKKDRRNYLKQIRKDNRSIVMVLGTISFLLLFTPVASSFSSYIFLVFGLTILYFILEPITHFLNFLINSFRKILNKKGS